VNKLLKVSAGLALATASALLLAGCAASDPEAAPAENTPAATAPAQTEAPATSPTQGANQDEELKGSVLNEDQIVTTLKALDFTCNPSELRAVDIVGVSVEFSTISCRRGQEPVVVFNLAANSNELELITIESCKAADGTVLKNPITIGANWQVLSAANDQPLLTVLGERLGGNISTIKEICS
jgi:hypothetical protein